MVFIQRPEFGGGDIYFDDVLVRHDGLFVLDDLLPLNPENLKKLGIIAEGPLAPNNRGQEKTQNANFVPSTLPS